MILNPSTEHILRAHQERPPHAVALIAPVGFGKGTIATWLAAGLLDVAPEKLEQYPYFKRYQPEKGAITIEMARDMTNFMKLKTSGSQQIRRVIIIEDAQTMTTEAQNALLKTLEEPPLDTVLLITMPSLHAVLPTISSRVQPIKLQKPAKAALIDSFTAQGYSKSLVERYYLMGDGLPGLLHALLERDTDHPLVQAIEQAKAILQADTFERLTMIDDIAKTKQLAELLFALKQTARVGLMHSAAQPDKAQAMKRWHGILATATEAEQLQRQNTQTKLLLTDLLVRL